MDHFTSTMKGRMTSENLYTTFYADTGYMFEDLPGAMDDRDG